MSFLNWLSGGSFESHVRDGDHSFSQGEYGEAKLAYQRALKKIPDGLTEESERIRNRLDTCGCELALVRIANARRQMEAGNFDDAMESLDDAIQIHDDERIRDEIVALQKTLATQSAMHLNEGEELSEEELLAIISGTWSVPQSEEFSQMPESFHQGLLAAHDGHLDQSIELLTTAIEQASECRFAYLELGRLHRTNGNREAALTSLKKFLEVAGEDVDTLDERVAAITLIAGIHMDADRWTEAEEAFMKAWRIAPDNHIPLFNLGVFLRERGELSRARTSFRNAMDKMGSMHPDMRVVREMGLTCLVMGDRQEARGYLEACLESCSRCGGHDQYDPEAAVPLAKMLEEDGCLAEACDIYRHLAAGAHLRDYFRYHLESARLLHLQGQSVETVQKYLSVAETLASTNAEREEWGHLKEQICTS